MQAGKSMKWQIKSHSTPVSIQLHSSVYFNYSSMYILYNRLSVNPITIKS